MSTKSPRRRGLSFLQGVILAGLGILSLGVVGALALLVLPGLTTQRPASAVTVTPLSRQVGLPTPSAYVYPTLPPEGTATAVISSTPSRVPPTHTESPTATSTRTYAPTPDLIILKFSGTEPLPETPFWLRAGRYIMSWTFNGPWNAEFGIVLGVPATNTYQSFHSAVSNYGPQSDSVELNLVSGGNMTIGVLADGPWRVTIREIANPELTPVTPSPAPT